MDKLCKVNDSKCIFTMGSSVPAYASAIISTESQLFFFDPHSRNEAGMASPNGKATVTVHSTTEELCLFFKKLSESLHGTSQNTDHFFELVSVVLEPDFEPEREADKFPGVSQDNDIRDGELTCKLYMTMNEDLDLSPVSSPYMSAATSSDESDTDIENTQYTDNLTRSNESACFNYAETMTTICDGILPVVSDHDEYVDNEDVCSISVENELESMNNKIDDSFTWLESVEPSVEVIENDFNEDDMFDVELNEVSDVVIENDNDWTSVSLQENLNASTPTSVLSRPTSTSSFDTWDEDDIPLALLRKTSLSMPTS